MSDHKPWCHWWWALTRRLRHEDERTGTPTAQQVAVERWQEEIGGRLERLEAERRLYQRKVP